MSQYFKFGKFDGDHSGVGIENNFINNAIGSNTATLFIKMSNGKDDNLFKSTIKTMEEYAPIVAVHKRLRTLNSTALLSDTHDHGTASWEQSDYEVIMGLRNEYPRIQNAVAGHKKYKEGYITKVGVINGVITTLLEMKFETAWILSEEVILDTEAGIELVKIKIRPIKVTTTIKELVPDTQKLAGNVVGQTDAEDQFLEI